MEMRLMSRKPTTDRWFVAAKLIIIMTACLIVIAWSAPALAQPLPLPRVTFEVAQEEEPQQVATTLQIVALLTVLAMAPAILVMMTAFTRIIVVLSFVRNALAMQQMPPNQILIGLALFLTFFIMAPVWGQVNAEAVGPYLDGRIDQSEALERATVPLREFMLRHTRQDDLALFVRLAGRERPGTPDDVATYVLVPAFAISELKTAFQMGFLLFIPFIVVDMIVASTLMSMGMLMLPPMMISLPFKILLFILVDGWQLVVQSLVGGFQ